MLNIFVDTAAWLALLNTSDALHQSAQRVMAELQKQRTHLVTTEFVLLEVADALSSSSVRAKTVAFITGLQQVKNIEIVPASTQLFAQGWKLYTQRVDKNWGLTDCISFVVMLQHAIIPAFTSGRHFEQAGFRKLL